jgi:hypothetical protein
MSRKSEYAVDGDRRGILCSQNCYACMMKVAWSTALIITYDTVKPRSSVGL